MKNKNIKTSFYNYVATSDKDFITENKITNKSFLPGVSDVSLNSIGLLSEYRIFNDKTFRYFTSIGFFISGERVVIKFEPIYGTDLNVLSKKFKKFYILQERLTAYLNILLNQKNYFTTYDLKFKNKEMVDFNLLEQDDYIEYINFYSYTNNTNPNDIMIENKLTIHDGMNTVVIHLGFENNIFTSIYKLKIILCYVNKIVRFFNVFVKEFKNINY